MDIKVLRRLFETLVEDYDKSIVGQVDSGNADMATYLAHGKQGVKSFMERIELAWPHDDDEE